MSTIEPPAPLSTLDRHHQDAIDQILACVADGSYCAVLGPRLSGKTELLRYVAFTLAPRLGWTCLYIDLYQMGASTLQGFFADLAGFVAGRLKELNGLELVTPEVTLASSAVFRGFLADAVSHLECDLVLIIEHLEAVPTDLVQALLTSLRAAYMDQQTLEHRLIVVVSGALSLATLAVGESSPFRGIARRVFVGDLSESQSQELIVERLAAAQVDASERALRRLLHATKGDSYLIRRICQRCIEAAAASPSGRLRGRLVRRVALDFSAAEVYQYAPLLEAIRLIEEDPDLLRCILVLLARGSVPRAELPLPLSPDVDPLFLTGVVERGAEGQYRIQNAIYRQFLVHHFHAGRVGHLLAMAGRWDMAIDYLEAGAQEGNDQARADLLPATLNSIYAAQDLVQAARFLVRGLSAGFGAVEAQVWYASFQEDSLRLIGNLEPAGEAALWATPAMPLSADRLEARAYRQGRALRGQEGERHIWRAMPLLVAGRKPIGVVTLCDDRLAAGSAPRRERDLQLQGYLTQAARALDAVSTRRRELALAGRMQASLLPAELPNLSGWQLAATLRPARETSGDYYDFIPLPGGRLGLVIADVADKGMGAALYMALSRTLIRTYAADHPTQPELALRAASQRILADTRSGLFVTVFYGILDPGQGLLTYCNAGHPPPYLLGAGEDGAIAALRGRGLALGVVEDVHWGQTVLPFPPGAALLLYTDGVLDAQNRDGERFGSQAVVDLLRSRQGGSAQEIQAALLGRLQQFVGDEPQFDDITLMVVRREPT